ncbi:hypothetical protein, partial [Phocaeicola sartorii]|uniref:hypothetical protein n=1 Tax=Phocaeicola sartorii TaxID=671267 RepID=UPI00261CD79C
SPRDFCIITHIFFIVILLLKLNIHLFLSHLYSIPGMFSGIERAVMGIFCFLIIQKFLESSIMSKQAGTYAC